MPVCFHLFVHQLCLPLSPADCYAKSEATPCEKSEPGSIWFNQTCYNATYVRQFDVPMANCTNITMSSTVSWLDPNCSVTNWLQDELDVAIKQRVSASEQFYELVPSHTLNSYTLSLIKTHQKTFQKSSIKLSQL